MNNCRHSFIRNVLYCEATGQLGHNGSGYCILCRDQQIATTDFIPLPGQSGPATPPDQTREPSSPPRSPHGQGENGTGNAGGSAAPAAPAICAICLKPFGIGEVMVHAHVIDKATGRPLFVHYACEIQRRDA